jgi:predicted ATP-binding protein involved in virulence
MLWAQVQTGVTLLANLRLPHHFFFPQTQCLMRTLGNAFAAVIATTHRPWIMTVLTAQIAALQEQGQAAARPINAGKGDDFTD